MDPVMEMQIYLVIPNVVNSSNAFEEM